ncbi:MAG: hypothetical protein JNK72_20490 [Myxococcales bacterium]|nr:hypothetical protein [Myxococcales bacterium]
MRDKPPTARETRRAERPPSWGIAAAFFVVVGVVAIVVNARHNAPVERDRDPLELASARELGATVAAVSEVIRARGDRDEEAAIARLEALHPQTPGAADLRDSCVTLYRGTHDAQRLTDALRAMLPPDGGTPSDEDQRRMQAMLTRSQALLTEARESHARCIGLYEQAAQRVGVAPAQRSGARP